jgi:hypothetical protein
MNSIFTNALPGQNEDAHIYTLKERFHQSNEENSGNNNNSEDIHRYENNQTDEQIDKFKDFNDQNVIQDYSHGRYYNRSRSRSRSRNRERSRSRERYRRDNQRSRSKNIVVEVIVEIMEEVVQGIMIIEKGEETMKEKEIIII